MVSRRFGGFKAPKIKRVTHSSLRDVVVRVAFRPAKEPINDARTCQDQFMQSQPRCLEILKQSGWETADIGKANAARGSEPLCSLWCIPGILRHEWSHAFKPLKQTARAPTFGRTAATLRSFANIRLWEGAEVWQ